MKMKKRLATIAAVILLVLIPALRTAWAMQSWVIDPATGCKIGWVHEQSTLISASWSGPVVDGKAQGKGAISLTIRAQNGKESQGQGQVEMLAGLLDGKVALTWSHGDSYDGYYKAGQREGKGIYKFADGRSYEGEWKAGQMDGKGIMKFADGRIYDGEWKNDKANGHGVLKDATGKIIYQGEWKDNKPVSQPAQPKSVSAGATAGAMPSWMKQVIYDPEVSAQTREYCQRAFDAIDKLFKTYNIVLSDPVTILVIANRESDIRATMFYFNMSRAQAEAGAGKGIGRSLQTKPVILINNVPEFAMDPHNNLHILSHELFHQVQYQYSGAKKYGNTAKGRLPTWLQEGSAELFGAMAAEIAGFRTVTERVQYVEQHIRKAAKIPDARELPYKWGYFLNQGCDVYQMAELMIYRLDGANFGKLLLYCQLLNKGSDQDKAFTTAFGVKKSDFLANMNDYFNKLRN